MGCYVGGYTGQREARVTGWRTEWRALQYEIGYHVGILAHNSFAISMD